MWPLVVAASGSWQGCHRQTDAFLSSPFDRGFVTSEEIVLFWIWSQVYNFCLCVMQNFGFEYFPQFFCVAYDSAATGYLGYVLTVLLKTGIVAFCLTSLSIFFSTSPLLFISFLYCLFPEAVEQCFIEMNLDISGSKDFKPHLTFLKLSKASRLRRRVSKWV